MDRLSSMEAFVTAAECGSYAKAAERMGLSAQMVAKHVAALEHRLGARLLNRTTRRQSLTELGHAYLERCQHILNEAKAADSLAEVMHDTPRGKLRISAPITFGACRLMPFVTEFLRLHPEIEIDLQLTDRFVDVVEEGFDITFRIGPLDVPSRPLDRWRLITSLSVRPPAIWPNAAYRKVRRTFSTMSAWGTPGGRVRPTASGCSVRIQLWSTSRSPVD